MLQTIWSYNWSNDILTRNHISIYWPPAGLSLVANPVYDFHGQDFKVQLEGGECLVLGIASCFLLMFWVCVTSNADFVPNCCNKVGVEPNMVKICFLCSMTGGLYCDNRRHLGAHASV